MQEEVNEKTISLCIKGGKITAQILKAALIKLLAEMDKKKKQQEKGKGQCKRTGKQSIKSLQKSGAQITNIVVTDNNIKSFDRVARKYGIDYSLKKVEQEGKTEYLVFFKAKDVDVMTAAFKEYLTMEEALEAYDKIPSERMNADKCIGFCIEEDGGFVGMYELVVNDKVQRENINSINYFRDDKLVQQAISDMEKLMAARQQSKEQERSSTKKSVLDALRSLKAKKQDQPAQEQDKPKKAKKKGMEL